MPVAPRPNKKATKIAFDILGTPPNMVKRRKSKKRKKIDRQVNAQYTRFVR